MSDSTDASSGTAQETAGRDNREELYPASFAQERIWIITERAEEPQGYVATMPVELEGALDREALERALTRIVDRHAVLRTTYTTVDGETVQKVHPIERVRLDELDTSPAQRERPWDRVVEVLEQEEQRSFDLSEDLPIKFRVLRLGEERNVLVATFHHIAFDGWSVDRFKHELDELYAAYREDREPQLPDIEIDYATYAAWQRTRLEKGVFEGDLSYWRDKLDGIEPLELPTDTSRALGGSPEGETVRFEVPEALVTTLTSVGREEGATPFMVLLALYSIVLSRYTGQEDITVGGLVPGRTEPELEPLIGFFVNTLPLRNQVDEDLSFRDLVARVRDNCREAFAHQQAPFDRIVAETRSERDPTQAELVQTVFSYRKPDEAGVLGVQGEDDPGFRSPGKRARFPFLLRLLETEGGPAPGRFLYQANAFRKETIEGMAECFVHLARSAAEAPDVPIHELGMLPPDHRERVLETWAFGPRVEPVEGYFHGAVERRARQEPETIAVRNQGQALTYRELDEHADRIAKVVEDRVDPRPDEVVGICLERGVLVPAAIIGVMKTGAAFLPLDPSYPRDRLAYMLEDSGASAVLTDASSVRQLPDVDVEFIRRERIEEGPEASVDGEEDVDESDLAYIVYTSGSTGNPKGVMVEHGHLATFAATPGPPIPRSSEGPAELALTAPFSFDAWMQEFTGLVHGHTIHVVGSEARRDPKAFEDLLDREALDAIHVTPTQMEMLREGGILEHPNFPRRIVLGGEEIPRELWRELAATDTKAMNTYGVTECTVISTVSEIEGDPGTVGKPLPGERVYLLDDRGRPVPQGAVGEVHIGGAGVARGYLGRPDLTSEAFVSDPFVDDPDARMYKTGDLARWRPDGSLAFLGRADRQVSVRGHRVELGEIEAVLGAMDGVERAVVTTSSSEGGQTRLIGYAKPEGPAALSSEIALINSLSGSLPEFMVPDRVLVLESFPRTPNGKLDKGALPEPDSRPEGLGERQEPRNELEEELTKIWSEVLEVDEIGIRDDFFEIGGNSLLAIRLVGSVEAEFDHELSLRSVFENPTIASMADFLGRRGGEGDERAPALSTERRERFEIDLEEHQHG